MDIGSKEQANKETIKLFQGIIGFLLYITLRTKPDIVFSVIKLVRFTTNPSNYYITLAKRVLRYLKAIKDYRIIYTNNFINYINSYYNIGLMTTKTKRQLKDTTSV